jgi:hypothetical protein
VETTIELKAGSTTTDQQTAIAAAITAVQNYINNLGIGSNWQAKRAGISLGNRRVSLAM